jgi:hypothetical protein
VWTAKLPLPTAVNTGSVIVLVTARDAKGNESTKGQTFLVRESLGPTFAIAVDPSPLPAGTRTRVTVTAQVFDDCGVKKVKSWLRRSHGSKRMVRLNDAGKSGDDVAGDAVFTGVRSIKAPRSGTLTVEVTAVNKKRGVTRGEIAVPVAP